MSEPKKRRKGSSPTKRSLDYARKQGWDAWIVEKWVAMPYAKPGGPPGVRRDLFGIIDVVVMDDAGGGVLGVQCSAASGHGAHRTKILGDPDRFAKLQRWLAQPARFEIWSWTKPAALRGKRQQYALRREPFTFDTGPTEDGEVW